MPLSLDIESWFPLLVLRCPRTKIKPVPLWVNRSLRIVLNTGSVFFTPPIHVGWARPAHFHLSRMRRVGKRLGLAARSRRRNGPRRHPRLFSCLLSGCHRWPSLRVRLRCPVSLHLGSRIDTLWRAGHTATSWISRIVQSLMLLGGMWSSVGYVFAGIRAHSRRGMYSRRVSGP